MPLCNCFCRAFFTALAFSLATVSGAPAADAPGCKDDPLLKRFEGSSIVLCKKKDFEAIKLPTGAIEEFDYSKTTAKFASALDLEGALSQNVYLIRKGPSALEVYRNYMTELEAAGFEILFKAEQADIGKAQGSYFGEEKFGPGGQLLGYSPDNARYASAKLKGAQGEVYASLYVVEYHDGYSPAVDPQKGDVVVRLDMLKPKAMQGRMVVVSAADIERSFGTSGKVAIYGILFDFSKADIKPESKPALDEIAKYLKAAPAARLHVVGHTDKVGGLESNQRLSEARALSVAAALAKDYGIATTRLHAAGVGLLAPVAPNTTEDGRAKNRRVELLPQ